jgi:hypothetical protein
MIEVSVGTLLFLLGICLCIRTLRMKRRQKVWKVTDGDDGKSGIGGGMAELSTLSRMGSNKSDLEHRSDGTTRPPSPSVGESMQKSLSAVSVRKEGPSVEIERQRKASFFASMKRASSKERGEKSATHGKLTLTRNPLSRCASLKSLHSEAEDFSLDSLDASIDSEASIGKEDPDTDAKPEARKRSFFSRKEDTDTDGDKDVAKPDARKRSFFSRKPKPKPKQDDIAGDGDAEAVATAAMAAEKAATLARRLSRSRLADLGRRSVSRSKSRAASRKASSGADDVDKAAEPAVSDDDCSLDMSVSTSDSDESYKLAKL